MALLALAAGAGLWLVLFIRTSVSVSEIGWVFVLGAITALRVMVLIALASLIWVPIGVWIGLRPNIADRAQPIVQFLAAFPANLFFPVVVALILKFGLNPEIWLSPLMILGTQWYIVFNVIAGTTGLPRELAAGGQQSRPAPAAVVAAADPAGDLPGLCDRARSPPPAARGTPASSRKSCNGATRPCRRPASAPTSRAYTAEGDAARIALGIGVLCLYVLAFNRLLWRRLYDLAAERLRLD